MTAGFPDWSRIASEVQPQLYQLTAVVTAGRQSGALYAGHFQYVNVYCQAAALNSDTYQVQLAWFQDQALSTLVNIQRVVFQAGCTSFVQFPALTEWCQVLITPFAGTATTPIAITLVGRNGLEPTIPNGDPTGQIFTFNGSVAASGSVLTSTTNVAYGSGVLCVDVHSNTAWHLHISFLQFSSNTFLTYYQFTGLVGTPSVAIPIVIPPTPLHITLFNDDTAARTIVGSLFMA